MQLGSSGLRRNFQDIITANDNIYYKDYPLNKLEISNGDHEMGLNLTIQTYSPGSDVLPHQMRVAVKCDNGEEFSIVLSPDRSKVKKVKDHECSYSENELKVIESWVESYRYALILTWVDGSKNLSDFVELRDMIDAGNESKVIQELERAIDDSEHDYSDITKVIHSVRGFHGSN